MAHDKTEAIKRGQHRKLATKQPFIAIEHRIFDSPAFVELKPNAKVTLFAIARQLRKDNNGHLQATASWLRRYGIGSEHTVKDAVAQLIAHGLIYRTRSHGANGQWATYALTWQPITTRDGLFLAGFVPNAWRDWLPPEKKTTPQKVQDSTRNLCSSPPEFPAKSAGEHPAESAEYESLLPCCSVETGAEHTEAALGYGHWVKGYLARLSAHGTEFVAARSMMTAPDSRNVEPIRKNSERRPLASPLHLAA